MLALITNFVRNIRVGSSGSSSVLETYHSLLFVLYAAYFQ